jgi:hypothetical protein
MVPTDEPVNHIFLNTVGKKGAVIFKLMVSNVS